MYEDDDENEKKKRRRALLADLSVDEGHESWQQSVTYLRAESVGGRCSVAVNVVSG